MRELNEKQSQDDKERLHSKHGLLHISKRVKFKVMLWRQLPGMWEHVWVTCKVHWCPARCYLANKAFFSLGQVDLGQLRAWPISPACFLSQ